MLTTVDFSTGATRQQLFKFKTNYTLTTITKIKAFKNAVHAEKIFIANTIKI